MGSEYDEALSDLGDEKRELYKRVNELEQAFILLAQMDKDAEGKDSDVASEIWADMMTIIHKYGDR